VKRRSWGLKNRNRTTLTAPERLKIMIPKNVAADGTWWWLLNANHRVMERGRTMKEYARG
jgi:hypothetical protein